MHHASRKAKIDALQVDRRRFLTSVGGAAALAALATPEMARSVPAPVSSSARIVIAGAGAAGLACASRLARRLSGATMRCPRTLDHPEPEFPGFCAGRAAIGRDAASHGLFSHALLKGLAGDAFRNGARTTSQLAA